MTTLFASELTINMTDSGRLDEQEENERTTCPSHAGNDMNKTKN